MTVFWILLAALVAAAIALFQYGYLSTSKKNKKRPWLALLRFFTVFTILFLLIAPKFNQTTYQTLLPKLILMVDDSKSIDVLDASENMKNDLEEIRNNKTLINSFDIETYTFSDKILSRDSITHAAGQTDISKAIQEPQRLYPDLNKAIVLLTDGNQTAGARYQYQDIDANTKVYPIIYGDTTQYADLKIDQINVNRYSYLNNEFPVEVLMSYQGSQEVNSLFEVRQGNKTLFSKSLDFSSDRASAVVSFELPSTAVGTQSMTAQIRPLEAEKNTKNNSRSFAVEVIDQQTKILLLHDGIHPDLGALKKAIESNEQRDLEVRSVDDMPDLPAYQLVIKYGTGPAFAKANEQIRQFKMNSWTFTGPDPKLSYWNSQNTAFQIEPDAEYDEVQPILNEAYASFNLERFDYEDYPPVEVPFGSLSFENPADILFYKQIGSIQTTQPFWFTYEEAGSKHAVTLASGLWRWRAQSYLNNKDFKNFDDLISSQVQYLASNKKRSRLDVSYEPFYYQNKGISINAQYLDKNYEFEDNGIINIVLRHQESGESLINPFVLTNNTYKVDLSGLEAGAYTFEVQVENENLSKSGSFSVLPFEIEKQFVSASTQEMQQLVGKENVLYQNQIPALINKLKSDVLMKPVERSSITQTSLVDWKWLLGLILLLLALEWFIRKYSGLV